MTKHHLLTAAITAALTMLAGTGSVSTAQAATGMSHMQMMKERVANERAKLNARLGITVQAADTQKLNAAAQLAPAPAGFQDYSLPNYANSPALTKFIDPLPGLCGNGVTTNCIPVAEPNTGAFPGSDYYEIGLKRYTQQMHSELPNPTMLQGYYQKNGSNHTAAYLGPIIVANKGTPVRIRFTNELPADSKHLLPVDTTVMGAGPYETGDLNAGGTVVGDFSENRAGIHLHGGFTPWISDGTPHQWVTPALESTDYPRGMSTQDVPDMGSTASNEETLYYPNQQSSRLMFYHDHAYGITRLNVYAGEAAGYILTDPTEQGLIGAGTLPGLGVPLIIQDKSFVWGTPPGAGTGGGSTPGSGTYATDPTWATVAPDSQPGHLWFPHVYVPNQDPFFYYSTTGSDGMNAMGRWDYGPWIWPPAAVQVPDTLPNPSIVPEAFMDTMVVNGKVYPYFDVQRKAYRFRILNASNDRFMNLQLYYAYDDGSVSGVSPAVCDGKQNQKKATCTEVAMVPRDGATYTFTPPGESTAVTYTVPDDGFRGSVPDPRYGGPKMLQIGNEGGFLPAAVVKNLPAIPITYDTDPKSMTVGNVKDGTIILGPAERADIVVDFSGVPDGARLILYNDAPAAFPAGDPRYDYFTGGPDLTANGGAASPQPGKGPNTRTIMQFRVSGKTASPAFNFAALQAALPGAYLASQDAPLVPQPEYPFSGMPAQPQYATLFNTTSFEFLYKKPANSTCVADGNGFCKDVLPIFQKAIAEEFDVAYGRMSALLGTEAQITNNQGQNTFGFAYVDPSTENLPAGVTQIWKITHNGVDTHAIHWHLINVQVINRVDWAGVIKPPDPDEFGWKETLRMNPLEDIIIAVQAKAPTLPFNVPDSIRLKDPTAPIGSMMGFTQPWPYVHDDPLAQPNEFPVQTQNMTNTINEYTNYGWEYVWHCHLLGHEENDMMRPLVMTQVAATGPTDNVAPTVSAAISPMPNAAGWNKADTTVTLTATDNPGGSGVATISVDGISNAYAGPYAVPFTTETPVAGTTITYSATDVAGNPGAASTFTVRIDKTAPTWSTGPTVNAASGTITVTATAADALSGLVTGAGAGSYVIAGAGKTYTGTFSISANGSFSFSKNKLRTGSYTVSVIVSDVASNTVLYQQGVNL